MSAWSNRIGKSYIVGSTAISVGVVLLIVAVLLTNSWEAISTQGLGLFTLKWNPPKEEFGLLAMLFGTLVVTLIALVIAVPLGVLSAIFISEFLSPARRFALKSLLELLAGIPSIIYGLIGIAFFSSWIEHFFDLSSGRTFLTAGVLLSVMILPTIITLVDDALRNVPQKFREASQGLGLYPFETIYCTLLPIAKSDIIGAVLLALGRALGETMAVMLVIGSIDKIPSPFFNILNPGQTITSKLGREIAESSFGSIHFSALIFMGLILLLIVLFLTIVAQRQFKQTERLHE